MEKTFTNIFKAFFKVGTVLLGGGYVILPLLTTELVEKRNWITSEELCEYYALSSSLPGIIAANTSVFTGRKLLGNKGAIAAIIGVTLPAFLAILLLASVFSFLVRFVFIQNIFWGVGLGIITLLFLAIREMWGNCITDSYEFAVFIICVILALFNIPPGIIILGAIISGLIRQKFVGERKNNV